MMNTALILNDLDMNQELDRAALAQITGGYTPYYSTGWSYLTTRTYFSSWKKNIFGKWYRTYKSYKYAKRTQYGKELSGYGVQYA